MSLKIKKEHLGKRIVKGNEVLVLSNELSQSKIKYVQSMISDSYVEEVVVKKPKAKSKDNETSLTKAKKQVSKYVKAKPKK